MIKNRMFWISFLLLFVKSFIYAQPYHPTYKGEIVEHLAYSLSYSEVHEQAEWVYYELDAMMLERSVERSNDFRTDPKVSSASASLADYKGSGYDRGHLAPAGDMCYSPKAMSESFYMSNMSPQLPSFNRGGWKVLEALVRKWVCHEKKLYVVSGPLFNNPIGIIGPNHVTIPSAYYKVIYAPNSRKMIAFIMPNTKIDYELQSYVVPVDKLEDVTGIDFFPQLTLSLQSELEAELEIGKWNFERKQRGVEKGAKKMTKQVAKKCQAHTVSGSSCKRSAKDGTSYCWQHENYN